MSASSTPEQGTPNTSNLGGKRVPGQRSAAGQNVRDSSIRTIKELWGVSEFVDIFPANIRPKGDLGDSAISNLRSIAKKMPNLGAARALMISECVDASGRASSLSFKHTANILNQLKSMEQMIKDEEEAQKAKVLNPEEKKQQEEAARKAKMFGKPPRIPVSKDASRLSEGPAVKPGLTPGSTFVASNQSAANGFATGQTTKNFKATPAKKNLADKTKAATPASKIGIVLETPSVLKVRQRKEPATGLRAPNHQDVAPFSKTLAIAKVTASKEASPNKAIAKEAGLKGVSPQKATLKETSSEKASSMKATFKGAPYKPITREITLNKKSASKNHLALGTDDWSIENATSRLFGLECEDLFGDELSQEGMMTDDNGIPIESTKSGSKLSTKRPNEDVGDLTYGGLPFSKESIMAELYAKKRVVERDGHASALSNPSEAETEIDIESVPGLLRDNVHIKFGFEEAAEAIAAKNKAADARVTEANTVQDKVVKAKDKVAEEKAVKVKIPNGKATADATSPKEKATKGKMVEKKTEITKIGKIKRVEKGSEGGKGPHGATDKGSKKRKLVASADEADGQDDVNVVSRAGKGIEKRKILIPVGIHPKLDVPFTTHFDKPSKDIASLWRDREKARASIPQTPTSPIDSGSPIREINLFNTTRPSSEISDPRLSKNTASESLVEKEHTDPKLSQDHSATGGNLPSKTDRESTVPEINFTMEQSIDDGRVDSRRDITEYSFSELVELARAKAAQSPRAGKRDAMESNDPIDYTIRELREYLEEQQQGRRRPAKLSRGEVPSQGLAGKSPSTPAKLALPKLPETLVARDHADRVLITSVPGIVKAYVEELRARIAGGKGPDGDLLSMIIVNKYGYFLEYVEKLEKDLESLYYEALERSP